MQKFRLKIKTLHLLENLLRSNIKYFLIQLTSSCYLLGQLTPIGSFDPLIDLVKLDLQTNFNLSKYRLIKEEGAHALFNQQEKMIVAKFL